MKKNNNVNQNSTKNSKGSFNFGNIFSINGGGNIPPIVFGSNFWKKKYEMKVKEVAELRKSLVNTKLINVNMCLDKYNIYKNDYLNHQIDNIDEYIQKNKLLHFFDSNKIVNKYLKNQDFNILFNKKINSLRDLIDYTEYIEYRKKYSNKLNTNNMMFNIDDLIRIKESLIKLDNMIGMNELKKNIFNQILYYLQNLYNENEDYLHTCIYGPPGTGKTEIAHIIGEIFSNLNILKNKKFKKATRADLIGEYLGQTSIKTKKIVEECLGGVLFIDEAYALGNSQKKDSFSKECIDTLCELLSFHKNNLMVIIAGYKDELKKCFFSYNPGLESRFTWSYEIDNYNSKEMSKIFKKKINESKWKIEENIDLEKWFEKNNDKFVSYGRDIEVLFSKVKICHSRNLININFCNNNKINKEKKTITIDDLEEGLKMFEKNKLVNKEKEDISEYVKNSIYL